jgi:hypothetical protein
MVIHLLEQVPIIMIFGLFYYLILSEDNNE